MGVGLPRSNGSTAATIIPSVGCPIGCNFCATSAFFGGRGKYVNFYETGEELFRVMCDAESKLKVRSSSSWMRTFCCIEDALLNFSIE